MGVQLEKLKRWGIEWEETLDRFMDDEDLYLKCVKKYLNDPEFKGLEEALTKEDYTAAFEQAHALKGVTANLGLLPIYATVCEIVEPLRHGDYKNVWKLFENILEKKEELRKIIE